MSFLQNLAALARLSVLGCVASSAFAQELTLDDAVSRAWARNPALQAEGHALTATERQAQLSGLPPSFTVGSEVENFAGGGALSGTSAAETTLRLSRVIELGGKRDARIALGASEIARQRNAIERSRIEIASEVTRRFVEVLARQERLAIARRDRELTGETRSTVARWVDAGRNPESDLLQSDIAVYRADLAVEGAERELGSAKLALSSLWGDLDPRFTAAQGNLAMLPAVVDFPVLAARLPQSADQRAFEFDAETLEAQRRVAAAAARPDLAVSLGARRLESFDDQALVFGIAVPLGMPRRAALGVERVSAELDAVRSRREAARLDAYQRLSALYQELQQARRVFETHRDAMIPKAEAALTLNLQGYERGRFGFLVLTQAQQALVDLRRAQVDAAARYHQLLIDIERLTATSGAATP